MKEKPNKERKKLCKTGKKACNTFKSIDGEYDPELYGAHQILLLFPKKPAGVNCLNATGSVR